jgi:hypothetical protein
MRTHVERKIHGMILEKTVEERQILTQQNIKETILEKLRVKGFRRKATRYPNTPKDPRFAWIHLIARSSRTEKDGLTTHWIGVPMETAEKIVVLGTLP